MIWIGFIVFFRLEVMIRGRLVYYCMVDDVLLGLGLGGCYEV